MYMSCAGPNQAIVFLKCICTVHVHVFDGSTTDLLLLFDGSQYLDPGGGF